MPEFEKKNLRFKKFTNERKFMHLQKNTDLNIFLKFYKGHGFEEVHELLKRKDL